VLKTKTPVVFDAFNSIPTNGRFVLVDGFVVSGGGIIEGPSFELGESAIKSKNITWEEGLVSKELRNALLGQQNKVLWFTGLSGSGKSRIAHELEKALHERGVLSYVLDGDNMRHGLNKDLGFSEQDRQENIRRVGEVSKLFHDSGVFVIACFISPYEKDRGGARKLIGDDFVEVFIDCPLEECEKRDRKGLYKKARAGEIKNFTGITAPYEAPSGAELQINTKDLNVEESVKKILDYLQL